MGDKALNRESIIFWTNGAGTIEYPHAKKQNKTKNKKKKQKKTTNLDPYLTPYQKNPKKQKTKEPQKGW